MLAFRNDRFSPSGTDGSNPLSSSGESIANLTAAYMVGGLFTFHDAERAGGAAAGRSGAAGAGIRGGQRGDRRGRGGVEPAAGDRRCLGRVAPQMRDQLSDVTFTYGGTGAATVNIAAVT